MWVKIKILLLILLLLCNFMAFPAMNQNKGFTLIELIISIAIFAFLSVMMSSIVNTAIKSIEYSREVYARATNLRLSMLILERDFSYIFINTRYGVQVDKRGSQPFFIFYKNFSSNPFNIYNKSPFVAFSYVLSNNDIVRRVYNYDAEYKLQEESYASSEVFGNVESFVIKFSVNGEKWFEDYNNNTNYNYINVRIVFEDKNIVERVFKIFFIKQ